MNSMECLNLIRSRCWVRWIQGLGEDTLFQMQGDLEELC